MHEPGLRLAISKKAKALRQIEATSLTREGVEAEFDRLSALLHRRSIADFDKSTGEVSIVATDRLWCCDEKGYNDESMSGQVVLVTVDNQNVTTQHSKSLKHISVLSFVSAAGEAAPPRGRVVGPAVAPGLENDLA